MTRRQVFRGILVAAAVLCLLFAVFVWWNINSDLSAENFEGESIDFARFIWVEINLMLLALLIAGLALLIAFREKLLSWRSRPRNKGEDHDRPT